MEELAVKLRQRGQAGLSQTFTAPARYGTAFHVRPPVADVRQLPPLPSIEENNLVEWSSYSTAEQKLFQNLSDRDPYYLWHIAQAPPRLIFIEAGATRAVTLTAASQEVSSEVYWIVVGEGAALTIQDYVEQQHIAMRHVVIQQRTGSKVAYFGLRAGNQFLHERVDIYLLGRQAQADITHLVIGRDQEQADMRVQVWHRARQTASTITSRLAAGGRATVIARGLIDIDTQAAASVGYQSGRALLLSDKAVVDMLPQLEIRTHDVQCSHGVTTTHLDDEALFYLRSRGLGGLEAERLALLGFFHDRLTIPVSLAARLEEIL